MKAEQAKSILLEALVAGEFSGTVLYDGGWYLHANESIATLDGHFSANELEAIATWMRNPKKVRDA